MLLTSSDLYKRLVHWEVGRRCSNHLLFAKHRRRIVGPSDFLVTGVVAVEGTSFLAFVNLFFCWSFLCNLGRSLFWTIFCWHDVAWWLSCKLWRECVQKKSSETSYDLCSCSHNCCTYDSCVYGYVKPSPRPNSYRMYVRIMGSS